MRYGAFMAAHETMSRAVLHELERQGLTRRELAERIGVHPSWVSNKMAGRRRWTLDDVDAVAPALGVPPAWLLLARDVVTRGYRRLRRFVTVKYQTRTTRGTSPEAVAA